MPTYTFKSGKKTWTELMSITEMEEFLANNRNVRLELSAPKIVSGVSAGRNKPSDGFRDILRNMKKKHRGSTINTW